MLKVNLLPWREKEKESKNNLFYVLIFSSFLIGFLSFMLLTKFISGVFAGEKEANQYIEKEINKINAQVNTINNLLREKKIFSKKTKDIDDIQKDRFLFVNIFNQIAEITPNGLTIKSIIRKDSAISLEGYSYNNDDIIKFHKLLKVEKWVTNIKMGKISLHKSNKEDHGVLIFNMVLTIKLME